MSHSRESKAEAVIQAWSKRWRYWEPVSAPTGKDGEHLGSRQIVISEQRILDETFEWWSARMREVGKAELISEQNCIEDFVIVHWASGSMSKLQQVILRDETADTELICWLPVQEYGLKAGSRITLNGIEDVVWTVRAIYGIAVPPSVIHRTWKVGGLA